jgi:glycerol-3-phosphate dehydrogenase
LGFKVQRPKHWFGEGEQDQKALFAKSVHEKCSDAQVAERIVESTWRRQGVRALEIFAQARTLTELIPGLGITSHEVEYIAKHEDVKTREDLLRRRLPIAMARSEREIADNGPLQDLLERLGL